MSFLKLTPFFCFLLAGTLACGQGSDQKIVQIEQLMDEIETITTDLDTLLAEANTPDAQ